MPLQTLRRLSQTGPLVSAACLSLAIASCGDARRERPAPASALSVQAAPTAQSITPLWVTLRSSEMLQGDYWPVQGRDLGSPDGRWLARLSKGELLLVDDADRTAASMRVPPELAEPQIAMWSPDGRHLVIVDQNPARAAAGPSVVLVQWQREKRALSPRILRFDDLPATPNRFSVTFNGNDRLLLVARAGSGPQLRPVGPGVYLGEARLFDLTHGGVIYTSTAAQAGNLMFGDVLLGIEVTDFGRQVYAEVRGKRGVLPLPKSSTLVVLGGQPAGDWLLLSGLEPAARTSELLAFNRLSGALVKLAEVGSFSTVVAAPELGITALQISTLAGETRLLLVDWRDAQRPRTLDAGPIVHLSGYDADEQRLVAVIKNSAGDSELAAFEP